MSRLELGNSSEQLAGFVSEQFASNHDSSFDLARLCNEIGNDAEKIVCKICEAVQHLTRQGILTIKQSASGIETPMLDTSNSSIDFIGRILRKADELDVLFKGKYAGNHEFDLHCTEYGKRFVEDQVMPVIKTHFGFDPKLSENDRHIVTVLKASPSAARFAVELKPMPSDLVKRRLLATVVIAGFSRDCLQNSQLILDESVRHSYRKIVEVFTADYERTIDFYEELALVGGFEAEKLGEIISHSEEWMAENSKHLSEEWANAKISLSQKVDSRQPVSTTLFPYFLLAGMRSAHHVELRCNYDSSITLDFSGLPRDLTNNNEAPIAAPCSFSVGPGQAQRIPVIDLRCRISFTPTSRKLSLSAVELSDRENRHFPLIPSLPSPQFKVLPRPWNLGHLNPPDVLIRGAERFYAQVPITTRNVCGETLTLTDIDGMSGGPIFAVHKTTENRFRYWVVAVQSG